MKVLVSSKHLAQKLKRIDVFIVERITLVGDDIILITPKTAIIIPVHVLEGKESESIIQDNRRWDWVKNLVNKVDEQPIVLDIHENIINVIFQY